MQKGFVPFAEVKRAVSLEAILTRYELLASLTRKGMNLAGPCPFCKGSSGRQFQANLVKNAWYCFGCKAGGNILDFVAKKEEVSIRTAALKLDAWFELGLVTKEKPQEAEASTAPAETGATSLETPPAATEPLPTSNPPLAFTLKTLDPHHESLSPLGFSTETIERFGAGYCTKGLLKERLAIPIHSAEGELVAYAGLAVEEDASPRYLFPPKFCAPLEVMNLHRLPEFAEEDGPLYLAPEIEGLLRLAEVGIVAALGLFDGSLSLAQEEAITGALPLFERLVLVGEDFEDRTIARLARHALVTWSPGLPEEFLSEEFVPVPSLPAVPEEEFLCTGKPR
jgi:DNA primase